MEYKDLLSLASAAMKAEKNAPVAYSYQSKENGAVETYSAFEVNEAVRNEFAKMSADYATYRENKNTIFRLIEETIDEALPQRVEDQYMAFADVKVLPQGDKAIFRQRITEAARKRAKTFVTRVGLAGRYETFMLDGATIEVQMSAIGAAVRIGFEDFLDGRIQFSELTEIILEGMDEYIYKEIMQALQASVAKLPEANKAVIRGFDETTMDELLAIADAYGRSTIYCTFEFAAKMKPADAAWASNDMKGELWKKGWLDDYKGHTVVIMPQSLADETNTTKAIDPSVAYILPTGTEKPVKLAFEGPTAVREEDNNADWSRELHTYKKFGIATLLNHSMCSYSNSDLVTATRHE